MICPLSRCNNSLSTCNCNCAFYTKPQNDTVSCLLAAALRKYLNTPIANPYPHAEYPNSNTGKDSHSDYWEQLSSKEETKIQSRFPHDDWDNPTCGWETWRIQDNPVLSSNRERQEPVFQPPRVEKSPW